MEYKILPFALTSIDGEGRTLEGYAATFGNVDLVSDMIHPGAFTKTLTERGHKVRLLWQHKTDEPIGRPIELREDTKGLFIKAIVSDTARGRDVLALLKDKAIDSMSIGYEVVVSDHERKGKGTIRNLRELKLHEVSPVTFPANEEALVTSVKAGEASPDAKQTDIATDVARASLPEITQERFSELIAEAAIGIWEAFRIPATAIAIQPSVQPEAPEKAALDAIEAEADNAEPDALPESDPLTEQATEAERLQILTLIDLEESENG